ncbi:hypothetical protein ACTFIW_003653 [Dictyostelium discoideum]
MFVAGSMLEISVCNRTEIVTLQCFIVTNREDMDKPKIINNSHSKDEQFKLIIDIGTYKKLIFVDDILKDSIIIQKDKIIKLNNSTYKIYYQQSNQLHCCVKVTKNMIPSNGIGRVVVSIDAFRIGGCLIGLLIPSNSSKDTPYVLINNIVSYKTM